MLKLKLKGDVNVTRKDFIEELSKINDIVAICKFGSHGTKYWIEDRSDIDLAIVVAPGISFMNILYMEDEISALCKKYYDYDNIHLTFILFSDFSSKYARIAVDSEEQYIFDENRWFDFQHYVLKFARQNRQFERMLKIDEQYSYFGGIVDDTLL